MAAELNLYQIQLMEVGALPIENITGLPLEVIPRGVHSSEIIEQWLNIYNELLRFGPKVNQPYLNHWKSTYFLRKNAVLTASEFRLSITCKKLPAPDERHGDLFCAVLSNIPWHEAIGFKIKVLASDEMINGNVVIRLCRNGHTAWEYEDLSFQINAGFGIGEAQKPLFKHQHHSYRVELLSLPEVHRPSTVTIEITADYPQVPNVADALPVLSSVLTRLQNCSDADYVWSANRMSDSVISAAAIQKNEVVTCLEQLDEGQIDGCNTGTGKSCRNLIKLLIIDSTPVGYTSATGQIKQTFLGD
jgi:hypothetical protein